MFYVKTHHGQVIAVVEVSITVLVDILISDMIPVCLFRGPDLAPTVADKAMFRIGTMFSQIAPTIAIKPTRSIVTEPVLRRVSSMLTQSSVVDE